MIPPADPFRGGKTGGNDDEAVNVGPLGELLMLLVLLFVLLFRSSFAGDRDLGRVMLFPLARRSQDGLDFGAGRPGNVRSDEEAKDFDELKDADVGKGDRIGLATSAYEAESGDGRSDWRLLTSSGDIWSSLAMSTVQSTIDFRLTHHLLPPLSARPFACSR